MKREQVYWDEVAAGDELPEISLDINVRRLFL